MKMITLELTFKNDEDYFKFMDDWGCSEGSVRIPSDCKIKVKDDAPMKVAQPIRFYCCRDCANENTDICDRCMGPNEFGSKPGNWKPKYVPMDCDEGRICPRCGKVMILCEDEKTYYQMWECDGCGHKEDD